MGFALTFASLALALGLPSALCSGGPFGSMLLGFAFALLSRLGRLPGRLLRSLAP